MNYKGAAVIAGLVIVGLGIDYALLRPTSHHYSLTATEPCLAASHHVTTSNGDYIKASGGDLDVAVGEDDLYVAFAANQTEASNIDHSLKILSSAFGQKGLVGRDSNVVYWTTGSLLTADEKSMVKSCLQ